MAPLVAPITKLTSPDGARLAELFAMTRPTPSRGLPANIIASYRAIAEEQASSTDDFPAQA
jgi:hypothetical protein